MYNVALRRVREIIVSTVKQSLLHICLCVCVCVRVAFFILHATRMRHIVTPLVVPQAPPHFSGIFTNGAIFGKKSY